MQYSVQVFLSNAAVFSLWYVYPLGVRYRFSRESATTQLVPNNHRLKNL